MARSWCSKHYQRWKRYGDVLATTQPYVRHSGTVLERFWAKVDKQGPDDCWLWQAYLSPDGYGGFRDEHGQTRAHRYCYLTLVGPLEPGEEVDHRCRNKSCVNPRHLRPASSKQNKENVGNVRANNSSGYRGVYWSRRYKRWQVEVLHHGKKHYGGRYVDIEEANSVAILLRNTLFTHNEEDRR